MSFKVFSVYCRDDSSRKKKMQQQRTYKRVGSYFVLSGEDNPGPPHSFEEGGAPPLILPVRALKNKDPQDTFFGWVRQLSE
jgi:hypothetical protein